MLHALPHPDRVSAARAGDPAALAALYQAHAAAVLAVAYRLTGSRADAEDVLHDVFLGLPEALARYQERGSFAAWLRTLAARTALMRLRSARRKREVALEAAAGAPSPGAETPPWAARLWAAVQALPESLRSVFVLREMEGYTHAEIAGLLGITVTASEVRLSRAMRWLRSRLEGESA